MSSDDHPHRAPADCPVCGTGLVVTKLGCPGCGSALSGTFSRSCRFCDLSDDDADLVEVFLRARGNMRELERHLGVSYPTARLRFTELLDRLGVGSSRGGGDADRAGASKGDADDAGDRAASRTPATSGAQSGTAQAGSGAAEAGSASHANGGAVDREVLRREVLARVERRELTPEQAAILLR